MGRKEEITSRIQAAALKEFVRKGVNSSTMEHIAKSAGITKRTLYKYYPNKGIIYDELIDMLLDSFDAFSDFTYSGEIQIEEQLQEIIDTKVALLVSDNYQNVSKLLSIELLKSNPPKEKHLQRFHESENKFITWIKDAQKDGTVTSEQSAELIANQFHSIIKGQVFYPVIHGLTQLTKKDIDTCKKTAKNFFINSFCG